MHLPENLWYPILESREVGRRKPVSAERLGLELVLWRDSVGRIQAHTNRCPHLGAALSKGHIAGDRLVCPFHGFEFQTDGSCAHIPANGHDGRIPEGIRLRRFELRESHGLIWLWWGPSRESYPEVPFFAELATGWRYGTITADWPVHFSRAIENQLDVAHLPFVHRTTIGAGGRSFVDGPYVEHDDQGIRVWVHNRQDHGQTHLSQDELAAFAAGKEPSLHLLYPGIWKLSIGPRLKQFIAFVPINARQTRYYLRVYHRLRQPLAAKAFELLMGRSNRLILNQDRRVVITQRPYDSREAAEDRMIGADRAIARYRHWLRHAQPVEAVPGEKPLPLS